MSTQAQFNELLKNSEFFYSAMATQRDALAEIVGVMLASLVESEGISQDRLITFLSKLEKGTGHPSIDSSRRAFVVKIRETTQR